MTNVPFPDSSELTKEDFIHSGWKDILGDSPMDRYHKADNKFSSAMSNAQEEGNLPRAKVFQLLAATCAMDLTNKSQDEPFEPSAVGFGMSTATLDWFSESDINFLSESIGEVDDPMLRGRLADMLWLRMKPKDHRFTLEAIDNYRSLDLNKESWVKDIGDCWKRALVLSLMLGAGAENRAGEMEKEFLNALDSATKEGLYFGHWLAKTLLELKLGRNEEANIAQKLKDLGEGFESDKHFREARDHYELAGIWFRKSGETARLVDMQVAVAEGWAKDAEQMMSSNTPSAIFAEGHYNNAIQAYQQFSRGEKKYRKIGDRINELTQLREKAIQRAIGEMKNVRSSQLDITNVILDSRSLVQGKEPQAALASLASMYQISAQRLRDISLEGFRNAPWIAFASQITLDTDGRVTSRNQGASLSGTPEENEPIIWEQIQRNYAIETDLVVQGCIMPALEVIHTEHQIQEMDFINSARNSPAVPPGRADLVGKALYCGYEYDFATAIHLLTPQIEHMVRHRLNAAGIRTTHTNQNGIDDEKGLSSLMEAPEFEEIFGEDLTFEIKALFSDHSGPNLRNKVAHGLLTTEESRSYASIYAWWLALNIIFRT